MDGEEIQKQDGCFEAYSSNNRKYRGKVLKTPDHTEFDKVRLKNSLP